MNECCFSVNYKQTYIICTEITETVQTLFNINVNFYSD